MVETRMKAACLAATLLAATWPLLSAGQVEDSRIPFDQRTANMPTAVPADAQRAGIPQFIVDAFWPKPLPNNWIIGQVAGVHVDSDDNIWIVHRPGSLSARERGAEQSPPIAKCCFAAPPVLEFDQSGNLLRAWDPCGRRFHLAGRKRRGRRADTEVHSRRRIRHADRCTGTRNWQQ